MVFIYTNPLFPSCLKFHISNFFVWSISLFDIPEEGNTSTQSNPCQVSSAKGSKTEQLENSADATGFCNGMCHLSLDDCLFDLVDDFALYPRHITNDKIGFQTHYFSMLPTSMMEAPSLPVGYVPTQYAKKEFQINPKKVQKISTNYGISCKMMFNHAQWRVWIFLSLFSSTFVIFPFLIQ